MRSGPLAGTRVVELGNLIAAPYAGMLLADLGADVVKVEPPSGDLARAFMPFVGGESVFFLALNRGKRSLALDPRDPEARAWLDRLVEGADVVVNNLRLGAMERMGYDEESVRRINPSVVYAVISAFGADGPDAARSGIDVVFQAASGMISLNGHPGDPPQKTATTVGDYLAGTNAALAVCAALVEKQRSGEGRRVDICLRDGLIAVQSTLNSLFFVSGDQPEQTGTASPFVAPSQVFATADGFLALAIVSDHHFNLLAGALGRPDLVERFPTNEVRMALRSEVVDAVAQVLVEAPTARWVDELGDRGLPVAPVMDLPAVFSDPQVLHNDMVIEVDHPRAGPVSTTGSPLRIDGSAARATSVPPSIGEHSRPLLGELGATADQVDALVASGAVVVS